MDTKKFLEGLSDKIVIPVLILIIVSLAYMAFSANLRLKTVRSELSHLRARLNEINVDQSYIGAKLPNELAALIGTKLKRQNNSRVKYCVLQFISMNACTPCAQKDIALFRKIATSQENTMLFFVVRDSVYRELVSLKQYYLLNSPFHFITYNPTGLNLFREPTTLLTTADGTILLRYTSDPLDKLHNDLNHKILQQFVNN
jgi:hypothetical protein